MKSSAVALSCLALLGCASSRPDHFYTLSAVPATDAGARAATQTLVTLKVTVPSLVDRAEMVIYTSGEGVVVLDHERWAAPFPDLVSQTLARDLEKRRSDILVADRSFGRAKDSAIVNVEIVQVTVRRGGTASLEAHWRISGGGAAGDTVGSGLFQSALSGDPFAAVPQALSQCLARLADQLIAQMPAR